MNVASMLQTLRQSIGTQPVTADRDVLLCLLEASGHLAALAQETRRRPTDNDLATISSCLRAAMVSWRSYLFALHDRLNPDVG